VIVKFLAEAACPYCYHKVRLNTLMFRCKGTGWHAPGRTPCRDRTDPARVEYLSSAAPVFPSFPTPFRVYTTDQKAICPSCGCNTGIRVCPVCHSVLPKAFGDEKSPLFGMVGVKGAGKTVYLTVLIHELMTTVRRRFGSSVRYFDGSPMIAQVKNFRDAMNNGGSLPPATLPAEADKKFPIVLEWQQEKNGMFGRSSVSSTILSFYDTAGEDLQTQNTTSSLAYLAAADGLIVVLDPFQFPENTVRGRNKGLSEDELEPAAIEVMSRITELLRETDSVKAKRKIRRPVALVVSKIDAFFDEVPSDHPVRRAAPRVPVFDEAESADLHNHVEALIDEWGGEDVLMLLRTNYEDYRFFAASALGAEPDYRTGQADSQGLRPHRVAEPLLWLMADQKVIARQG
jgi:hypothetical protein